MRSEPNDPKLEREYSGLLSALSKIYSQIFSVDLRTDQYIELYASGRNGVQTGKTGPAQQNFRQAVEKFVGEESRTAMESFLNQSTLAERLADTQSVFQDFQGRGGNWWSAGYVAQERDEDGKVVQVLFTLQDVDARSARNFSSRKNSGTPWRPWKMPGV